MHHPSRPSHLHMDGHYSKHILFIESVHILVHLPGAGLSIKTSLEVLHAVQGDEVNKTEDEDNLGTR